MTQHLQLGLTVAVLIIQVYTFFRNGTSDSISTSIPEIERRLDNDALTLSNTLASVKISLNRLSDSVARMELAQQHTASARARPTFDSDSIQLKMDISATASKVASIEKAIEATARAVAFIQADLHSEQDWTDRFSSTRTRRQTTFDRISDISAKVDGISKQVQAPPVAWGGFTGKDLRGRLDAIAERLSIR